MNFLVSAVTHLPPIKVAQRKQYKDLPSPQVGGHFALLTVSCGQNSLINTERYMILSCFYPTGYEKCPLGKPGALQSEAGVCQHFRQLVWLHAPRPLSVSPGPSTLQRSSVCPP